MAPKSPKSKNQADDVPIDPFEISPTTAELAITMLKAKEPDILCKTLKAISIFAKQQYENKVLLYNLDAISYILPHINSPQFNVRRFALLNLALLCLLPETPENILEDPETMQKLAYQLVKVEDIFTLEYTSLCISRLTTVHEGCNQLIQANILGTLFKRMKDSLDPDVQNNCLQTLSNMLEDPLLSGEVTKNPFFSWPSIMVLTRSKFIGLQNGALKMVGLLVSRYDDVAVQTKFRASTGIMELCDLLEWYEFRDIHVDVLDILKMFVVTGENAKHLYTAGCIPRLQAYLDMALPKMKAPCLAVLTALSFTPEGRDGIYATETDLIFCDSILNYNLDIVEILGYAAQGIANMCAILTSAVRMCNTGIAKGLCSIIADNSVPWFDVRINTLKALVGLSRLVRPAAVLFMKPETFTYLRSININYKDNPEEAQMLALQCYLSLLTYTEAAMKVMLNETFMNEILDVIGRVNIKLQLLAIKVMCIITQHDMGKDLFTHNNGEQVISDKLKIHHNGLRNALCQLIIDSVTYEGAEVYLDLGTIAYMSENLSAGYSIKLWEKALGKILEMHPSAKFGILGRLDINDVTNDGFYVLRRLGDNFPSINSIMSKSTPGINPVYIAILHPQHHQHTSELGIRTPYSKMSRGYLSSISISNRNCMALLPDDNNLKEYIYKLRHLLGDPRRSLHYVEIFNAHYDVREIKTCDDVKSDLKRKAQTLAEFVVREMSGGAQVNEDGKCCMPNAELHIAELMNQFKTNIIGIGFVRYGGILERAIMYKVLADKLGIPCALHRKCSGYAWCVIAVPESAEPLQIEEKYPAKYLRINYVVNLNDSAKDRLYLEGGYEANKIIGPSLPPYVVGKKKELLNKKIQRNS